jgi:hypothetical protein
MGYYWVTNKEGTAMEATIEHLMKRINEVRVVLVTLVELVTEAESDADKTKWTDEKRAFLSAALESVAYRCDHLAYDLRFTNDGDSILWGSETVG